MTTWGRPMVLLACGSFDRIMRRPPQAHSSVHCFVGAVMMAKIYTRSTITAWATQTLSASAFRVPRYSASPTVAHRAAHYLLVMQTGAGLTAWVYVLSKQRDGASLY